MIAVYRLARGGLVVAGLAALLTAPAALATVEGLAAAEQVSEGSYYDYMDTWLFTHAGDNRGIGGPEHDLCRDNIASLLTSYGFTVTIEPFTYSGGTYHNVVGTKTGTVTPGEEIVIGAHYDSVSNPGADDDASGVALILECARIVGQYDSDRTIRVCAFSREEQGLVGAYAYVAAHAGDNIIYMLQADMVAYDPGTDLARIYSRSGQIATDLIAAYAEYGGGVTAYDSGWNGQSDHAAFDADGIDAALMIESEVWNNPYYHSAQDNFEQAGNLNFTFAAGMTRGAVGWLVDQAGVQVPVNTLAFTFPDGRPEFVDPSGGTTMRVEVSGLGSEVPAPGTGVLHYNTGSGWQSVAMTVIDANTYDAVFPAASCPSTMDYYVSADSATLTTYTNPHNAPATTYVATVANGLVVYFEDDFEFDLGWTSSGTALDGQWDRGVPVNCNRGDPAADSDGSGQCYLTDNSAASSCNSDVDDGYAFLDSPNIDLSGVDAEIIFDLWYDNAFGGDPNNDLFKIYVSNNSGGNWSLVETIGPGTPPGGWNTHSFTVSDHLTPTANVRVRFEASDLGSGSVVEAGVDAFTVFTFDCSSVGCPEDIDGLNGVGQGDLNAVLNRWGDPACVPGGGADPCPEDLDGLNGVGQGDLNAVLNRWGDPDCE